VERKGYNKSSDIWSLGILLYYMLTNKKPFDGQDRDSILKKIINGTLRMPPHLPEDA